jgi:hypothetical protein
MSADPPAAETSTSEVPATVVPAEAPPTAAPPADTPAAQGDLLRRLVVVNAIIVVFLIVVRPFVAGLYELRVQRDWGSDWKWLQDGFNRLAAGLPLTRPEYTTGSWSQFLNGKEIPTYAWSLHPPYSASLYAPFLLAPGGIRPLVWDAAMVLAFGAAIWLAWPRRLWWGTALLILSLMLWLPGIARSAVLDEIHYGNPNALVMLGVALAWLGRRRGSTALIAAGLVLAALKIVPAVGLGVWLLVARKDPLPARRAILAAVIFLVIVTIPILYLDPGAIGDLIASQANLIPWAGGANLSPQIWLAPSIGHSAAVAVSYGIGAILLLIVLVRRLDGPGGLVLAASAPLLFTPQLWAHWFLIPAVAVFATAGEWRAVRAVDERLRDAIGFPARLEPAT